MSDDQTGAGRHMVQFGVKIRALENRVLVKVGPFALGAHAEERLAQRPEFDRSVRLVFDPQRPGVDLVAGTISHVGVVPANIEDQAGERNLPANPVTAIGRPFGRVGLIPDQLLFDCTVHPAGTKPNPHVRGRRDGEREVVFGRQILRLVEHVLVDAEVRQRDGGIHPQRTDANTYFCRIGTAFRTLRTQG